MWSQPTYTHTYIYIYILLKVGGCEGGCVIFRFGRPISAEKTLRIAKGSTRREEMLTVLSFMLAVVLSTYTHAKKHISFRHIPLKGCV
jgi:hypothetical protein